MHSNIQLPCDCADYAKYEKFYDDSMAFERSLYWDFAECLLVCLISGIVLFFLFVIYVRVRKINGTLPIKEKAAPVPTQTKRRRAVTNKMSRSSSVVAIYRKDSVSSTASTSDSSFDSSCRSDESSSEDRSRRPAFMTTRRSFVKMVGTIKELPQKVQDEMPMPSFARRISGNRMKRSLSTSQVSRVTTPLATPVHSSTESDDSSVFTTSTTSSGDDTKPRSILVDSRRDIAPSLKTASPTPATATALPADSTPAPASLESTQERSAVPSTPRRPTLTFARSMLDVTTSTRGPRSQSFRLPPLPRKSSARKSSLCIHVEDHEGEGEEA